MKFRPRQLAVLLIAVVVVVAGIISPKALRAHRQLQFTQAAWAGDLATVRRCVEAGVAINAWPPAPEGSGGGPPALTAAAYMGHDEIVRYLLDHGANPNLQPLDSPLIVACWQQHPTVARLLLEHGADPNVMGEGTSLYAAESTGQTELAALLRQYGATLTFK